MSGLYQSHGIPEMIKATLTTDNPLERQIAGSHYKNLVIQPVEFITKNNIGFLEGCVIKRVCRYKNKNGIEDLQKAIHELELLIELTRQVTDSSPPT